MKFGPFILFIVMLILVSSMFYPEMHPVFDFLVGVATGMFAAFMYIKILEPVVEEKK